MNNFDELYGAFRHQYMLTNPPPKQRSLANLGWQFYLGLLWAVATVIMVASQTATEFYQSKVLSGMDPQLAIVAASAVVVAVEGGLIIGAAIKAARERKYTPWVITLAIVLCVVISVVAGVNSSIGIIPNLGDTVLFWMRVLLVAILGVGGSLVAWAAGELVGAQIADVFIDRDKAADEHMRAMGEYNERMRMAWKASPEYVLATTEVKTDADVAKRSRRSQTQDDVHIAGSNGNGNGGGLDYRLLTSEQRVEIANMGSSQIVEMYSIPLRTAQNWRKRARAEAGLDE